MNDFDWSGIKTANDINNGYQEKVYRLQCPVTLARINEEVS